MIKLFTRSFLYTMAWLSFILGFIGAFLPVLPTTPFMILSAYLFNKSSPRMHSWLTSLPYFGDAIMDWDKHRVIRPKAKAMALVVLWTMMAGSIIFSSLHYGLKIMLAVIAISVSAFILTRRSYAQDEAVPTFDNISNDNVSN